MIGAASGSADRSATVPRLAGWLIATVSVTNDRRVEAAADIELEVRRARAPRPRWRT